MWVILSYRIRGSICTCSATPLLLRVELIWDNLQFTAPDLSTIARQLDDEELEHNPDRGQTSENMDDTGFFSVQVVTRALDAFALTWVIYLGRKCCIHGDAQTSTLEE